MIGREEDETERRRISWPVQGGGRSTSRAQRLIHRGPIFTISTEVGKGDMDDKEE